MKFNTPIKNKGTANVRFMFRQIDDNLVVMDIIRNSDDRIIYSDIMNHNDAYVLFDGMTADD